jgi:hypothetical protein
MESIPENLETLLRSLASDTLKEDKNSKSVRHSSGQIMRLLLDAKRTEQGYRGAEVFVGPSCTALLHTTRGARSAPSPCVRGGLLDVNNLLIFSPSVSIIYV